jgi:hypothetical protein
LRKGGGGGGGGVGLRGRRGEVKQWKEHQGCCFHTNQATNPQKSDGVAIKVNKNENFLASILNFVLFHC